MSVREEQTEPVSILLVDDRPTNLTALEAVLKRPDYDLVFAQSGPEALGLVLRQEFAVILLDVAMPRMDGFETASIIKQRDQSKLIPIIFVTASVYEMEHVFRGYNVGAVDYLLKPVDPHALRAKVAVFVELYRQRTEIEKTETLLREAEVREQQLLRRRAEDALQQSEALYQLTFEGAPIGIGHATPNGRWISGNRRLAEILGCDPRSLVDRLVTDMAVEGERGVIAERLAGIGSGNALSRGEHHLISNRREPVWAELTLWALRDPTTGEVGRIVVIVEDISEQKKNELERARLVRELQEGIRARDDFLSIAGHELKTPLTPLRLQAASLLREVMKTSNGGVPREELGRRLAVVDKSAQRLEVLIDRLLEESDLNVNGVRLDPEEVDLGELVKKSAARLQEAAERAETKISISAEDGIIGRWDPLRIDQAVTNLLSNAIKYGGNKPVEVRVSADAETARFSVRDHGMGIPEEAQDRIFDRFERIAPLRHFSGFGLGLWIVRRIVEAHGGHVKVWSRPREGAEFSVELPRHADLPARLPEGTVGPWGAHA